MLKWLSQLVQVDPLHHLIHSNDIPSDAEAEQARARLRDLKAAYHVEAGRPFGQGDSSIMAIGRVAKLASQIRTIERILSTVRLVPEDVWRHIFVLCIALASSELRGWKCVYILGSVCRSWRHAALSEPRLWSEIMFLPRFVVGKGATPTEKSLQLLSLHLQRAGESIPLSFQFSAGKHDQNFPQPIVSVWERLANEVVRWDRITIQGTSTFLEKFTLDIRGRFHKLTEVTLRLVHPDIDHIPLNPRPTNIPWFADAPNLRHFNVYIPVAMEWNAPRHASMASLAVSLPWAGLESYKCHCNAEDGLFALLNLAKQKLIALRRLDYRVALFPPFSSSFNPVTIHSLETLVIQVEKDQQGVIRLLNTLILPSLSTLELRVPDQGGGALFNSVRDLVVQSQCTLRRLLLGYGAEHPLAFQDMLLHCPRLEHLEIGKPPSDHLRVLVLDKQSTAPVLPQLRSLSVYLGRRFGLNAWFYECDGPLLVDIARSRLSTPLGQGGNPSCFRPLEELRIGRRRDIWGGLLEILRLQKLFDPSPSPGALEEQIEITQSTFGEYFWGYELNESKMRDRVEPLLKDLEEITVDANNIRPLFVSSLHLKPAFAPP